MKECCVCHINKPLSEFLKNSAKPDGKTVACRECMQARDRARYEKDKGKRLASMKTYISTANGKRAKKRAVNKYNESNTIKRAAHIMVGNALRDGKLERKCVCETCHSAGKLEAHHDDYTKPLDVRWLCICCHIEWHKNNTPIV